jgi:hypothetical protein
LATGVNQSFVSHAAAVELLVDNFSMAIRLLLFLTLFLAFNYAPGQSRKDSLIVFVGEIIEVKYSPEEEKTVTDTIMTNGKKTVVERVTISMDNRYVAKYKVLQMVYGTFKEDTIEFSAYDHYGKPGFSNYKTALLFVSNHNGELYHQKYQYFDVYLTTDNKWASPGDPYKFDDSHRKSLKPQKLEFKESVFYDLKHFDHNKIKKFFPEEYFNIIENKAYPLVGSYIEDLFIVKKDGVLKARGIF